MERHKAQAATPSRREDKAQEAAASKIRTYLIKKAQLNARVHLSFFFRSDLTICYRLPLFPPVFEPPEPLMAPPLRELEPLDIELLPFDEPPIEPPPFEPPLIEPPFDELPPCELLPVPDFDEVLPLFILLGISINLPYLLECSL